MDRTRVETSILNDFEWKLCAMGVDVVLSNNIFLFLDKGFLSKSELFYQNGSYGLKNMHINRVYDSDFSTVKFLFTFNKNPMQKKNFLMLTSLSRGNGNLYILDITDVNNIAYVSKKILIPNHIIEQTLVTRDFIVTKGCINQTQTSLDKCA